MDLIENCAALRSGSNFGYPRAEQSNPPFDAVHDAMAEVRELLSAVGLLEAGQGKRW